MHYIPDPKTGKPLETYNGKAVDPIAYPYQVISYELKDRRSLIIPNPVYTCDVGGVIVINIQVNALGKVTKTSFNKKASSTQNGCLIESAETYAKQARFTTAPKISNQKGTITYSFPGQQWLHQCC